MADFCKDCSIEMWGKDNEDLSNLISRERVLQGYAARVLCEGCEGILVNHLGVCIDPQCKKHSSYKKNDSI